MQGDFADAFAVLQSDALDACSGEEAENPDACFSLRNGVHGRVFVHAIERCVPAPLACSSPRSASHSPVYSRSELATKSHALTAHATSVHVRGEHPTLAAP